MKMRRLGVVITSLLIVTSSLAVPITEVDLGGLDGNEFLSGTLDDSSVHWYSFEVTSFNFEYIDINTNGSLFDTEIGLYNSLGDLIASDNNDGLGDASTLSFDLGSRLLLGDATDLGGNGIAEGEDGVLGTIGVFYLAIGSFDTVFGADSFNIMPGGPAGDYEIAIYSFAPPPSGGMPEPTSLALLVLAAIGWGLAQSRLLRTWLRH